MRLRSPAGPGRFSWTRNPLGRGLAALVLLGVSACTQPAPRTDAPQGGPVVDAPRTEVPISETPDISLRINFQHPSAPTPDGYLRDSGEPFGPRTGADQGEGLSYGWLSEDSGQPTDFSRHGRARDTGLAELWLDTLMHMQPGSPNADGFWELELPSGVYRVTVGVGDSLNRDSVHRVNIEDQNAVAGFVPTASNPFATATRVVAVVDGRLTVDALGGSNTKLTHIEIESAGSVLTQPRVVDVRPGNGVTELPVEMAIATDLNLPNGGVDGSTVTAESVMLREAASGALVPATVGSSGGFDTITLTPASPLLPNTLYQFEVTSEVRDQSGVPFLPFSSTFTTSATVAAVRYDFTFEKVVLTGAEVQDRFSSLTIGPDGRLYATTIDGRIKRFPILADGTLGNPDILRALYAAEGGPRLTTSLVFDPSATANDLVAWVAHTHFGYSNIDEPWSGKISRLSGPDLSEVQDYIVGLPRSLKDHVTNSIAFNPREPGVLYFNQGSNAAMGAPDRSWGWQPERLLTAATLRFDYGALSPAELPLNARTEGDDAYDPYAEGAPLTIYGSGIRNAYDLIWHSNGHLYVPGNGSASGGVVPRTPEVLPDSCQNRPDGGYDGPRITSMTGEYIGPPAEDRSDGWQVTQTQNDFLYRVEEGGYYGHPNPLRCEWVMNGGNYSQSGNARVVQYPSGTQSDPNYRGYAFNFGLNISPNGVIEYRSDAFGGALQGKLLVARYSNFDDLIILELGGEDVNYGVTHSEPLAISVAGRRATAKFLDPLTLVENPATGDLYVSEFDQYGSTPTLTLLRPVN